MRTPICERFGIEYPIFGFSHCRDVVAAVSKAGGMGVLGAALFSPEQLETELAWIDDNVDGKPYGLDVVMPAGYEAVEAVGDEDAAERYRAAIPKRHWEFVDSLAERFELPEVPPDQPVSSEPGWNADVARKHIEIGFAHPIRFLVNALGPPPPDVMEMAVKRDIPVGALAGKAAHAARHVDQGVDVIVCQGYEAGGHTGDIGTMVLVPEVVDAVGPDVPVLAAGGIGSGRQVAAALALGAQGAWLGSVWLATLESDVEPEIKERYLAAQSAETMRTRENSGKPSRGLRTPWREAWLQDDSPGTLKMPLQGILTAEAKERIKQGRRYDLMHASVGQIVGRMNQVRPVREVVYELVEEYIETTGRLQALAED